MQKPVAVILLNWNTPLHTANCITSILNFCNNTLFDIIVVDNGSTDGSLDILSLQFPGLIYIDNKENLGFAEGNNRGLDYSISKGYTYSLVLNNDTTVDEDVVSALLNHLESHNNAAAVQPAIYWMHNPTKLWSGPCYFSKLKGITYNKGGNDIKALKNFIQPDWLTGCCMLVRNTALRSAGMFNKKFFLYYEDVDLSYRLHNSGNEIHYLPATKVYHEAGVSGTSKTAGKEGPLSPIIHYYVSRNHLWFLRGYGNRFLFPLNLIYNFGYYGALLCYFIIHGKKQKISYLLKGLKEGLFTPKSLIWHPGNY